MEAGGLTAALYVAYVRWLVRQRVVVEAEAAGGVLRWGLAHSAAV